MDILQLSFESFFDLTSRLSRIRIQRELFSKLLVLFGEESMLFDPLSVLVSVHCVSEGKKNRLWICGDGFFPSLFSMIQSVITHDLILSPPWFFNPWLLGVGLRWVGIMIKINLFFLCLFMIFLDHRGHLLLLFEILLFSSDPVITKYLNSFALWREFVDELRCMVFLLWLFFSRLPISSSLHLCQSFHARDRVSCENIDKELTHLAILILSLVTLFLSLNGVVGWFSSWNLFSKPFRISSVLIVCQSRRSALEVIQITPKTFAPRPPKGAKKRSESASSGSDDPAVLVENVLLCLATDVLSTTSSSSPPFNVLDSGSLVGDRICAPESEVFAHEDKENATLNRMDLVGKNDRRWSEVDMTKAGLVKYASSCGLRPRIPAPGLSKQGMDFVLRLEASRPSCPGVGLAVGELWYLRDRSWYTLLNFYSIYISFSSFLSFHPLAWFVFLFCFSFPLMAYFFFLLT